MKIDNWKLKIQTINSALAWATRELKKSSRSPALDSEVLLCHILKRDKSYLYANQDKKLSNIQNTKYQILIRKRARRWPVAYLTGRKEFFGLDFVVTPDVLIPRPETELLVELAIQRIKNHPLFISPLERGKKKRGLNIIDLGTGSGCIIISLAKKLAASAELDHHTPHFYATDSSTKALKIACANARRHGVAKKIRFIQNNLFENCKLKIENSLLLANLPYLTPAQVKSNPDLKYEPCGALVAGKDGMEHFKKLFKQIPPLKIRGGKEELLILLEHDPSHKSKLKSLAKKYFPKAKIKFHRDLSGRFRICEINFPMLY